MLKYANQNEKILKASNKNKEKMADYLEYYYDIVALKNEIFQMYDYPLLRVGIDELIRLVEKKISIRKEMNDAGYTASDAIALKIYNKENQRPEK